MQIVAKTETGATYSIISRCNGENQLPLETVEGKGMYQKVLRLKVVGSHIDNSHACPLPPSSEKIGVAGRNDCLYQYKLTERRESTSKKRRIRESK